MKLPIDILKVFENPSKYGFRHRDTSYVGSTVEIIMHHKKETMMHQVRYDNKRTMHFTEGIMLNFKYDTIISNEQFRAIERVL